MPCHFYIINCCKPLLVFSSLPLIGVCVYFYPNLRVVLLKFKGKNKPHINEETTTSLFEMLLHHTHQ